MIQSFSVFYPQATHPQQTQSLILSFLLELPDRFIKQWIWLNEIFPYATIASGYTEPTGILLVTVLAPTIND